MMQKTSLRVIEEEKAFTLFWCRFYQFVDPSWYPKTGLPIGNQTCLLKEHTDRLGVTSYPFLCHSLGLDTELESFSDFVSKHTINFSLLLNIFTRPDDYIKGISCCLFPEYYLLKQHKKALEDRLVLDKKQIENFHLALSLNTRRERLIEECSIHFPINASVHSQAATHALLLSIMTLPQTIKSRLHLAFPKPDIERSNTFFDAHLPHSSNQTASLARIFRRVLTFVDQHLIVENRHV